MTMIDLREWNAKGRMSPYDLFLELQQRFPGRQYKDQVGRVAELLSISWNEADYEISVCWSNYYNDGWWTW